MIVNMLKCRGGTLIPSSDLDVDKMSRLKSGDIYPVTFKLSRNPRFHGKVFAFFNFCFDHWDGSQVLEHGSQQAQFDRFRKDLTILAGYYEQSVRLNGDIRTEAKSLSFGGMEQEEFEQCYIALTNAACKHIFHTTDEATYNKLIGFF